jgi:hypothetical protein
MLSIFWHMPARYAKWQQLHQIITAIFGSFCKVVQDKANRGVVGKFATFTYAFGTTLTEEEVRMARKTANDVTSNYTATQASMQCSYYDAAGQHTHVKCTYAYAAACAGPGEHPR